MVHRLRAFAARLLNHLRRADSERDLGEQIDAHARMIEDDFVSRGMTPEDARAAAKKALGNEALVRQLTREQQTIPALDTIVSDVRLAARRLRRQPATTVVSIVALAGGIATTAVAWSLLSVLLLHPLAAANVDRLVHVGGVQFNTHRYPEYTDVRASGVFDAVAGVGRREVLIGRDRPEPGMADFASHDFFDLLGLVPTLGRAFLPEDDQRGAPLVAMLSNAYWRRAFGARPDAIGAEVVVSGQPAIVVGVLPRRFLGMDLTEPTDIYLPLHAAGTEELSGGLSLIDLGTNPVPWMSIVGRLPPGSDATLAADRLRSLFPDEAWSKWPVLVVSLNAAVTQRAGASSGSRFGVVMVVTVGLLLAIGCLATGELLLLRTESRRDELALCLALGASRLRLLRGIVAEGALLALGGALVAAPMSAWLFAGIRGFELPGGVQVDLLDLTVDRSAILAATIATMTATWVIAFLAGMFLFSLGTHGVRRPQSGATPRLARSYTRLALGAGQVAISLVLLAGAALFAQSIAGVLTFEPDDDVAGLVTATISPFNHGYTDVETSAFFDALQTRLSGHPAIEAVSVAKPYTNFSPEGTIYVDGQPNMFPSYVHFQGVDDTYFSMFGLPLVAGRAFSGADRIETASSVAIVSESFGRLLANGGDPVGRQLAPIFWRASDQGSALIVGVVPDLVTNLNLSSPYVVYMPIEQMPGPSRRTLFLRATIDPAIVIGEVARVIRAVDPSIPLPPILTIGDRVNQQLRVQRFGAVVMGGVGTAAALLTALGFYVLAETLAGRRRRELAIRSALGASRPRLGLLVLRETLVLAGLGVIVGAAVVWAALEPARGFLFQVEPFDPASLAVVSALLLALILAVSLKPARAATRMDVARILAEE